MSTSKPANITAIPAADQLIEHDGKRYTTVKEGLAYILIPESSSKVPKTVPNGDNEPQAVFYNPIQQFNRDLSVLAIKAYGEGVLEEKRKKMEKKRKDQYLKRAKKRKAENQSDAEVQPTKAPRINGKCTHDISSLDSVATLSHEGIEISTSSNNLQEDGGSKTKTGASILPHAESHSASKSSGEEAAVEEQAHVALDTEELTSKSPSFTILDALSATGLRALRYAQEIPFTTSITANDLVPEAANMINLNVQHNRMSDKIKSNIGNAMSHMYTVATEESEKGRSLKSKKYDVIDLDPYGTAAIFLDAAVQAVQDGGLLCVTCTDAGIWASNGYPEKCYSLYGGTSIKGVHSHEGGLRLILNAIATSAARYGLAMQPLLSLSIDFYARVFVRIKRSPSEVKFLAGKTMVVYNCDSGCGAWTTQPLARNKIATNKNGMGTFYKHVYSTGPSASEHCQHCGMKTHMAGPMYAGPIHSPEFISKILSDLPNVSTQTYGTTDRIKGMLNLALEETIPPLNIDASAPSDQLEAKILDKYDPAAVDEYPFFFIPSVLSKVVHCITPHEDAIRGALRYLGYRVTRSHTKAGSIKTDAPWSIIWEVMREWVRQKCPIKEGAVRKGTAGYKILRLDTNDRAEADVVEPQENLPEIVFDEQLGKETDKKKLVRYQINPRENWGPMTRARGR